MATDEMITTKTVVELDEKTTPVDADLFMAGDAGTAALKKFKWSNLLAAIKTKLAAWTFNTLTTNDKTLPGALNELNSKLAWKKVTESSGVAGGVYVNLSQIINTATEIHVVVQFIVDGHPRRYSQTLNAENDLTDVDGYFPLGGYYNTQYHDWCEIAASRSHVKCHSLANNGNNCLADAKMWVSYR